MLNNFQAVLRWFPLPAVLLAFVNSSFSAQTNSILFSDNLEQGTAAWSIFPGTPICTAPQYASTATLSNVNHTPGGSFGFSLTNASDRVYHDISLPGFPTAGVYFSVYYYDLLDTRAYSFEPFDVRAPDSSQVFGLGTYFTDPNYEARILYNANGTSPNWVRTSVPRTLGWHHFEIFQFRGPGSDTVDFYIDGTLGYHAVGALDATVNRVVLGLGWAPNINQAGYVDDILVTAVPEPASLSLCAVAVLMTFVPRTKHSSRAA